MSKTAVGLSDTNLLFENLFINIIPTEKKPCSDAKDLISRKSMSDDDGDSKNRETIPFQEILGHHIVNPTVQDTHNPQKFSRPAQASCTSELFQGHTKEINPSACHETPMISDPQKNAKKLAMSNTFSGEINSFDSLTSTKSDVTGFEKNYSAQRVSALYSSDILSMLFMIPPEPVIQNFDQKPPLGNGMPGEKAAFNTDNISLFYSEDENFPAPVIQDLNMRNTVIQSGNIKAAPPKNPDNMLMFDEAISGKTQEPELAKSTSDTISVKELPDTFKALAQDISRENSKKPQEEGLSEINGDESPKHNRITTSRTNEEWNFSNNSSPEQKNIITALLNTEIRKASGKFNLSPDTQSSADGIQLNPTDFQQNTQTASGTGTMSPSSSIESQKESINHSNFTTVDHTNIMEQIFEKINLTTHGDKSEIKLHLTPPELGSVKIHFTEEHNEIEAKIFVENAEVKAAIENNVRHLKESVADTGMEIHKLEVYIQNDNANKQNLSGDADANNPHYQMKNREGRNEEHSVTENNTSNDIQTGNSIKTSNVLVDYFI